jgi:predicted nucleic acid-binding protein
VIVADTSVWIDFFRGGDTAQGAQLVVRAEEDREISLTDVVLAGILQGLRSHHDVRRVERRLAPLEGLRLEDLDDVAILDADADFDRLASCSPLKIA